MANIPTVPGSEMVSTPASGAKLNLSPLLGRARGQQAIAGALDDVSNVLIGFSQKMQAAKNAETLLGADLKMSQAQANFRTSLSQQPDESTWTQSHADMVKDVQGQIFAQPMGPEVKRQLSQNFRAWATHTGIEVGTMANTRAVARIEQTGRAQYEQAIKDQDPERANAGLDLMSSVGAIHPKEAQRLRDQIPSKIQVEQINNAIINDPANAPDKLEQVGKDGKFKNWTAVDDKVREQLLREAQRRRNAYQTENLKDMLQANDGGQPLTPESIQQAEDNKTISPQAAAGLRKKMDNV